jgi:hypothetical protein
VLGKARGGELVQVQVQRGGRQERDKLGLAVYLGRQQQQHLRRLIQRPHSEAVKTWLAGGTMRGSSWSNGCNNGQLAALNS